MKAANPYLNFAGNTEEAFTFYKSVFGGDFIGGVRRFRDFPDNPMNIPETDLDKIAHIALPLGPNNMLMGTDSLASLGQALERGNNFYITVDPDSAEEADRVFERLSSGGSVEMPLQKTEWAERYGICADRFGIQWMVNYTGNATFENP